MDDHLEPLQNAQLPVGITENSLTNGVLIGTPPITFDGDRSKTDRFITQFGLFRIINDRNTVITNPKRRVALALTYIRGPKVDDWVSQQFNALSTKVFGDADHAPTHTDTDEALWGDFMTEFKRAYNEMREELFARLKALQMTGDDVEMYIATFENLIRQARLERDSDRLLVDSFRDGLPIDIEVSIMERDTIPDTIDEWQLAARKEAKIQAILKTCHPEGEDTDAVQTGVTRRTRMSEEERARRMAAGRCFECNEKGHLARDCLDKLEGENVRN